MVQKFKIALKIGYILFLQYLIALRVLKGCTRVAPNPNGNAEIQGFLTNKETKKIVLLINYEVIQYNNYNRSHRRNFAIFVSDKAPEDTSCKLEENLAVDCSELSKLLISTTL